MQNLDLFGKPVFLQFQKQTHLHTTRCGGGCSIFTVVLFMAYVALVGLRLVDRSLD